MLFSLDLQNLNLGNIIYIICFLLLLRSRVLTASAPGKALLAGGYLVLDKTKQALSIAVSSRFYATIKRVY